MNKKGVFIAILIFTIAIISITIKIVEHNAEEETKNYLLTEKNMHADNIVYLKAEIGKAPLLAVEVHFRDDPGMRYFYKKEEGGIVQFNTAPPIGSDINKQYEYKYKENHTY